MIWNGNSNKKQREIPPFSRRPMEFCFLVADLPCRLRMVSSRGKMPLLQSHGRKVRILATLRQDERWILMGKGIRLALGLLIVWFTGTSVLQAGEADPLSLIHISEPTRPY